MVNGVIKKNYILNFVFKIDSNEPIITCIILIYFLEKILYIASSRAN